ncbi:MAG: filamentous hemagglutinin N-terminal domain-containing protein [Nodosilinea sp.]
MVYKKHLTKAFTSTFLGGWIILGLSSGTMAQNIIVPDDTLGAERSQIDPVSPGNDVVDGGAIRGANLFHSFLEFNVANQGQVYFVNPSGIENIFSRVTGSEPSDILGTLGVNGAANLFFLNPNGITFGLGSFLDVDGSFIATTSDDIQFGERGSFGVSEPNVSNLLTINPSALIFNQPVATPIINKAGLDTQVDDSAGVSIFGLRVPDGRSLLLVGGDIEIDGGRLNALSGHVELAGILGAGAVGLNINEEEFSLTVPDDLLRADVSLLNQARLDVRGKGTGSITISGRNINILDSSQIRAGVRSGSEPTSSLSGDITLNATNNIQANGFSSAGSSAIRNDFVNDSILTETSSGGNIYINTASLLVENGAQIEVGTDGQHNPGSITINALENVIFQGEGSLSNGTVRPTRISSRVENGATTQRGGNIQINARELLIADGAQLSASTNGQGDGGSITFNVNTVEISGVGSDDRSGVFSQVLSNAGNSENRVQGGSIVVIAETFSLNNGAILSADTRGSGDAGNITVEVQDIFIGQQQNDQVTGRSSLSSEVEENGTGRGGEVRVRTNSLTINNGEIVTSTSSQSSTDQSITLDAGNIQINARGPIVLMASSIDSRVERNGFGARSGNISINAESLEATNNSGVSTSAFGSESESAGTIIISVDDYILISGPGGGIFSQIDPPPELSTSGEPGNSGSITITARQLELRDEVSVTAQSTRGNAGNISIQAGDVHIQDESIIRTDFSGVGDGSGGAIDISGNSIRLFRNSDIRTNVVRGAGGGGNITLTANDILAFGDSDILAFAQDGQGGNITLNTPAFFGENYQPSPDGIDPASLDGNDRVDINATGAISGIITIPDVSFIQNSLAELPETVVDTQQLIAGSCIARTDEGGSFIVSGSGGLPERPSTTFISPFPTGEIRPLADDNAAGEANRPAPWQPGDPIVEPEGLFQLPDGRLVVSQRCERD